jgi:hypothetical protein
MNKLRGLLSFSAIVLLLVLSIAGGCKGQPAPPIGAATPSIDLISAELILRGMAISNDVLVRAVVPSSYANSEWKGTVAYYLDVEPPTSPDEPAITAEGTYQLTQPDPVTQPGPYTIRTANSPFTVWENLTPGEHIFSIQLVDPDLMPLSPPVIAEVTLRVPEQATPNIISMGAQTLAARCDIRFGSPGAPAVSEDPTAEINVSVEVDNFRINGDAIGEAAVPGEGHLIYYLDEEPPTRQGEEALTSSGTYAITDRSVFTWAGCAVGEHTLWVQLVNNDNTPLASPVIGKATLTVPASSCY